MTFNDDSLVSVSISLGAVKYLLYNMAGAESFWNQKSQDPCRHNSAKIIGPCQYVYEKCWPGRYIDRRSFTNPAWVWGAVSPPESTGQVSGGGPGGEAPGSSEDLVFYNTKMITNNKTICMFEFLGRIVPSCLIRLQKNLEK